MFNFSAAWRSENVSSMDKSTIGAVMGDLKMHEFFFMFHCLLLHSKRVFHLHRERERTQEPLHKLNMIR